MKVLVVDDDSQIRKLVVSAFHRFGTVDEAENGRDAVIKFIDAYRDRSPYGLVLLDFEMPVMNGGEALYMIRSYEKDHQISGHSTPIILISGRTDLKDLLADVLRDDLHLHVLGKPLDFKKLVPFLTTA